MKRSLFDKLWDAHVVEQLPGGNALVFMDLIVAHEITTPPGAIAIALGLGSRLAGLALFGDQVIAMITVTWASGIGTLSTGGYEFNITLAALALSVVALGSGRLSIDNVIRRRLRGTQVVVGGPSSSPPSGEHIPLPHQQVASTRHGADDSD